MLQVSFIFSEFCNESKYIVDPPFFTSPRWSTEHIISPSSTCVYILFLPFDAVMVSWVKIVFAIRKQLGTVVSISSKSDITFKVCWVV